MTDRALDQQVATQVMGWKGTPFYEDWDTTHDYPYVIPSGKPRRTHAIDKVALPSFSTYIGAAMAVVERLRRMDYVIKIFVGATQYRVTIYHETQRGGAFRAHGVLLPEAICRVALAAVKP